MEDQKCSSCSNSSTHSCLCGASLCHAHVPPHFYSLGDHRVTEKCVSPGNLLCELCRRDNVRVICNCANNLIFCEECRNAHSAKYSGEGGRHRFLPVEFFSQLKSGIHFDELSAKYDRALSIVRSAREQFPFNAIQEFERTLDNACEQFISDVQRLRENTKLKLEEIRRKAEAELHAVAWEIESNCQKREYVSSTPFINSLLRGRSSVAFRPQFLASGSILSNLSLPQSIEVTYKGIRDGQNFVVEVNMLPIIRTSSNRMGVVTTYSLPDLQIDHSYLQGLSVDGETTYCFRSPTQLYCIGGQSNQSVTLLSFDPVCKSSCASLNCLRRSPGVLLFEGALMAFGGHEENSCERLSPTSERQSLASEQWVMIGKMSFPRAQFNPTQRNQSVYLVGGVGSKGKIERYSGNPNAFQLLPFVLPSAKPTTSFLIAGEVVVLLSNQVLKLTEGEDLVPQSSAAEDLLRWSPLIVYWDGFYYFYRQNFQNRDEIYRLSVTSYQPEKLREVLHSPY